MTLLTRIPRDVWIGLALLVAAALYWLQADRIPISPLDGVVNAAMMPKTLGLALAILASILILRALAVEAMAASAARAGRAAAQKADADIERKGRWRDHLRALGVLAFGVAFLILLRPLGYIPSVALLVGGMAFYMGARPGWRMAGVALAAAATFHLIFVVMLGIPLPAGFAARLF